MNTPDINALRSKLGTRHRRNIGNFDYSRLNGALLLCKLLLFYLSPLMIWTSFRYSLDYTLKEFLELVIMPFEYIMHNDYWAAMWTVIGNILVSFVFLLLIIIIPKKNILGNVWSACMKFDENDIITYTYILTFVGNNVQNYNLPDYG
jgi:hypothetical protein